jgi:hypothetical protein
VKHGLQHVVILLLLAGGAAWAQPVAALVRFDFESATPEGWQVVAGDLGRFVCDRPVWYDGAEFAKQGKCFLSTIETPAGPWDDGLTGVAESPVFIPSAPAMSFLIGGGQKDAEAVTLCREDGTELARATGHNSHIMRRVEWQVPEAVGKPVFLRLSDQDRQGYGWLIFDAFQAEGTIDAERTATRAAAAARSRRWEAVKRAAAQLNPPALRRLIADLADSFGERFQGREEFLARLDRYEAELAALQGAAAEGLTDAALAAHSARLEQMLAIRREIALANPLVGAQPLVYVVRHQYAPDHHNTETLFHTGEPNCGKYAPGGALKLLDLRSGQARVLVDPGLEGAVRDPEVSFDGTRILFSLRRRPGENYHIYEVQADGSGLRPLTSEPGATDIDPAYLPDDSIVFSSTREPKYCHCNMHIMANLYRMAADGANIRQIGKSTLFEGHSTVLPDGRLLYYRWEYVDRNFGDAQGLWTMNPDGTNPAVYWGNNTPSPGAVFDARPIPGTQRVVCIFGACHDRPWGALAVLDRRLGVDADSSDTASVIRVWPDTARAWVGGSHFDTFIQVTPHYEDPWPLADLETGKGAGTYFLVSRSNGLERSSATQAQAPQMGIYLVDTFGNEILLHEEVPGCFDPMPLAPHPRPPLVPSRRNFSDPTGTFYVQDVYRGTHLAGVKRGDVAALRVVESREKRFWTGPLWECGQFKGGSTLNRPAISWAGFEVKQILGTVPVDPDGSAHFVVPAERFVYFQLLDRQGMLISTMRSGTMVQPGETTGCTGCHENRLSAPPLQPPPQAALRPPDRLADWYGPTRPFNYLAEVQPVWDRHCVRCHDFGQKAGAKLVLARDKELVFNASYVELFQKWKEEGALLDTVGLGLAPLVPANAIGARRSRLVDLLQRGHEGVKLTAEEMDRIVTWIDIGGPYYPDYASAHPDNVAGRAPLSVPQVKRLEELTGAPILGGAAADPRYSSYRLWLSFDRPELSPCLRQLDRESPAYREALALLQQGQAELQKTPEADLPGFRYGAEHQAREDTYQRLREAEITRRRALAGTGTVYDPGIEPAPGQETKP